MNETHERAVNKAFAKISKLLLKNKEIKNNIKANITGPLTLEHLQLMYDSNKTEIEVWNYIALVLEKQTKYDS